MRLQKLKIEQFRNISDLNLDFDINQNLFAIIGKNAQGKTNILESIYLLALTKSFRVADLNALILTDHDYFRVQADIVRKKEDIKLEVIHQKLPKLKKAHKINDVKKTITEYVGNFQVTLFTPDDMNLVFASPAVRRKHLDVILSQVDRNYLQSMIKLKKIIKNRNQILKQINRKQSQIDELEFWDIKLAETGQQIVLSRIKLIEFFNQHLSSIYNHLSQSDYSLNVQYRSNMRGLSVEELRELISSRLERDLREESTTLGPHRDNFMITLNQQLIEQFCSRGEIRSVMLALRMSEIKFFESIQGVKPLLLLDDAFSELDTDRTKFLNEIIQDHQTIITTTDDMSDNLKSFSGVVWHCQSGQITD